jgi:hypothetical protein
LLHKPQQMRKYFFVPRFWLGHPCLIQAARRRFQTSRSSTGKELGRPWKMPYKRPRNQESCLLLGDGPARGRWGPSPRWRDFLVLLKFHVTVVQDTLKRLLNY